MTCSTGGRSTSPGEDTTLYNYQRYIDREIKPVFGPSHLSKLNALDLDRFYGRLLKRGLAPATVRQIHAVIRASLNQGERWGLVGRNVARLASAPSQPQREQHPPSIDDVHDLLAAFAAIDPMFGLYARFVVATGLRRAEACGVRWSDVDFDAGSVSIARSYLALPNGVRGDRPTKTRSARLITLDPDTVSLCVVDLKRRCALLGCLRSMSRCGLLDTCFRSMSRGQNVAARHRQPALGPSPQVCWRAVNDPPPRSPTLAGHHTSRRWSPGADGAARLGHADGTTTMKVYAHRTKRADEQAAPVVAAALRR